MKKIFTTLLIVFSFTLCKAQWVTIPDAAFVSWLTTNYPSCMSGNQMDTTCYYVENTTSISINNYSISNLTGIQYFNSLTNLWCTHAQLSSLPPLPNTITNLNLNYNLFTTLASLPPNLHGLSCNYNSLTSLPSLPSSLDFIGVSYNQLTSLPALPDSLTDIQCAYNQLTGFPALPDSLTLLECRGNQITVLPTLPNLLEHLFCSSNLITSLPSLPPLLVDLDCESNQLSSIPSLPNSLTYFKCSSNQITTLPLLPDSLEIFWCSSNQLLNLPNLPNTLLSLKASNNQLTSLPDLPDSLYSFQVDSNALMCMPYLKCLYGTATDFDISGTFIDCLPNVIAHNGSVPAIDTMPICDIWNSNGCQIYWNISGKTYFDDNSNCIYNSGETTEPNMHAQLWQSGNLLQQVFTTGPGAYSFDVNSFGTYLVTVDTTYIPFSICPAAFSSIISANDSMDSNLDFAFVCDPDYEVVVNSVSGDSGWVFPNNKFLINIQAGDLANFYGASCMSGVGGQLQIVINGAAQYAGYAAGSVAPASVTGNTVTWNIADFGAVDFFHDFHIRLLTDTNAVIGSQVCIDATVSSLPADVNLSNNTLSQCFTVVNSFDPNVKEVSPAELQSVNEFLTYTIHFQNTGTAPAQHIQIIDTLDSDLDASTFQLLAYSHPNMTQVLEGGIVKFNFPNINLPDSNTNEPASHGYIQYKIKPLAGTPLTSAFDNTAYIYFDFNSPVVTNTTHTSFATGVKELAVGNWQLAVYPNPAESQLTVGSTQSRLGVRDFQLAGSTIEIQDVLGRKIYEVKANQELQIINIKSFSRGIYFIKVRTEDGSEVVKKFVKE